MEKVHRHGYSTTDQRGRPGGSGPIIGPIVCTSTSLFKSDQWSLLKKEVEVRSLNSSHLTCGANSKEIVDIEERNGRLHGRAQHSTVN